MSHPEELWALMPLNLEAFAEEVHIWQVFLSQPADFVRQLEKRLSPDELLRAKRFHFERDTHHFIVCRASLRGILGRYLNQKPEQIQFCYGDYGKPRLASVSDNRVRFNVSHSHELALIAVCCDREVGIDIERIRPFNDMDALARHCFSAREMAVLNGLKCDRQQSAFFQGWTRKEAYLKALGDGFHRSPQSVELLLSPDEPTQRLNLDSEQSSSEWWLQDLSFIPGYAAALAVQGCMGTICYY